MPENVAMDQIIGTKGPGTELKNTKEREEVTAVKKKFNTYRKYSFPILMVSIAVLLLQCFLKKYAEPISSFSAQHPIFGYALQLKKISSGIIGFVDGLFWISLVVWYLTHSLKQIQQFERGVIRMFGKWRRTRKAGLCLIIYPFEIIKFVEIYERRVDIAEQPVYSSDNILAKANAIFWIRIKNAAAALLNVDNWEKSVPDLLNTAIRSSAATIPILDLNGSRNDIKTDVELVFENKSIPEKQKATPSSDETSPSSKSIDGKSKKREKESFWQKVIKFTTFYSQEGYDQDTWGIQLTRAEIQEFKLPDDLEDQLRKVMVAKKKVDENRNLKDARIEEATGLSEAKKLDYNAQIAGLKGLIDAAGGKEAYAMLKVAEGLPDKTMIIGPETLAGLPTMIAQAIDLSKKKMGQQAQ